MAHTKLYWEEDSDLCDVERSICIKTDKTDMNIYDFIDDFIRPLLHSIGYTEKSINEVLIEDQD